MEPIAYIRQEIINLLALDMEVNTPIYMGDSNREHIRRRHPYEYERYLSDINNYRKTRLRWTKSKRRLYFICKVI